MSIQKRRQKRVKPLRQIQNHIGEARRSANVRQCPPLVEQVENRILFSSTFTRAITLLGIGNSGYDFAHDTNLKRDNDALQTAAGAASLAASYQPFNPVVQATAIVTNGFAFASGTAVLAEDIGHETPATITGDIFSLVGNAAGVAGGAVNLGAALDPDPASRAAADAISGAFDLVGAHAQIISIAAERGPAAAAAMQDYLRSLQNAVGYALNNVTVTASSQYKAALSAVQNALNASATVLANTGSSTFTGNAKSAANAFNQSVAPVNNFIAASKLPKVNDIVTVAPGSFSVTSNGSTLLKGTSTDTTSAGIETITASGQSGSVNFKSTNSINNASVVQTDTNTTTSLSVTAKILPSGQASETVTGPNGTADLSNAAINLGIGTSATVVGNGDTISESATGDKLTVYGNNNNTTLSGNSSSVTDHGTHDTDTLNGSNESAIVTGPNDTTYLQNSTDHVMHTGAGDTVTGPGANISVKINLGAWQPIQAYTHVGFIDHTVAVFSVNPSTAQVDASMFTATILWGDGTQSSGTVAADPSKATGFPFVVLGSHVYATSGDFPVTVTVNGPKGATARGQECSVDSISMPSAASNPATKPPVQSSTRPLTYVTIFPQAWQPLESYAGVGFKLNTVGVLSGSYDGAADTNIADYKVVINWGDSPSWTSGIVAADPSRATGFSIVLLGSHTYAASGDYPIVVNVTGPDGMTVAAQTSQCDVSAMPNHLPGAAPAVQGSTKGLTYVTVNPQAWQPIQSYEGVGFRLNTVGVLSGKYDGIADNSPGDYKVQINWGDSSQWTSGFVVADPNKATGFAMVLLGSHVYNKTGDFPIVVNVTGPDGITVAAQTCGCDVSALPGNVTGTQPPIATGDKPETEVTVNPQAVTPIETVVGKIISGDPVAVVGGSYDGTSDTSAGDYHAYIDFGDGSQWVAGQVVNESLDGFQIAVLGSHTYSKAGDYAIVVVITGPDGETVARQTCGCDVQN